jgi:hypothetical protein
MRLQFMCLLFLTSICHAQVPTTDLKKAGSFSDFYLSVEKQFRIIDSLRYTDGDSLESLNTRIAEIIASYADELLNYPDTLDYDLLYIAKSADKNIALVSWDTRRGGTMIAFTTMALFKTSAGVRSKALIYDTGEEGLPYTFMHYNHILYI